DEREPADGVAWRRRAAIPHRAPGAAAGGTHGGERSRDTEQESHGAVEILPEGGGGRHPGRMPPTRRGGECGELLGHEPDAQVEIAEAERRAGVERWQARDQLGAARGAVQQGDAAEVDTLRGEGLDRPLRGAPVHDARGGSGGGEGEGPEAI